MVLVVWLPWLWTKIAEAFSTEAGHIITACTSFDSFFAPGAELGIYGHPLSISFFFKDIFHPKFFLITCTRTVIVRVAFKAKYFSTCAFYASYVEVMHFDTICAVDSCAKLIVSMDCWKLLGYLFFIWVYEISFQRIKLLKKLEDSFVEDGTWTTHAFHEGISCLDWGFEVVFPAVGTIAMGTNVTVKGYTFNITDIASA